MGGMVLVSNAATRENKIRLEKKLLDLVTDFIGDLDTSNFREVAGLEVR